MELKYSIINGRKIIALPFYLEALLKADKDLKSLNIGISGKMGFIPAGEETASWRSETLQKQLVAKGASQTMYSNHRRGTAVDCYPDKAYCDRIAPIMKRYGLVNDLGPVIGDWVHWNWMSNTEAQKYSIINEQLIIKEFSMDKYDNYVIQMTEPSVEGSGTFALVYGGEKHIVTEKRTGHAALTVISRKMIYAPLTKEVWDSIPTGKNF